MKSSEWTAGVKMVFLWIPQVRFIPNTVTYCLQTLMRRRFSNRSDGGQAAEHWDSVVLEGADWSSHQHRSEHLSATPVEVSDAGRPSAEAAAQDHIGDKQQQSSRHNRPNKNIHLRVAGVPLVPVMAMTPGLLDQPIKIWHNSHTGVSFISRNRVNWGQHAELKPQAISFIHINLAKVAKRAKLIRLIDFFPLSDSLSEWSTVPIWPPCWLIVNNNLLGYCWSINNWTA